jgi:hypothetical protein
LSQAYQQACIAVLGPTGAIWGTGVAIGGDRFATCAHVVAQALGCRLDARREDLPTDRLPSIRQPYLSGADSEPLQVEIEAFRSRAEPGGFADIAILALARTVPQHKRRRPAEMPRFSRQTPELDEPLFVTGFPQNQGTLKSLSDHASYRAVAPHDNEWIGIEDERSFGSEIRPGFSGAPVWSHTQRAIVGLVSEADWKRRTAAIIPNAFVRRLAELPEVGSGAAAAAGRA